MRNAIDQYKTKESKKDNIDSIFKAVEAKKKLKQSVKRKEMFESYYGKVPKLEIDTSRPKTKKQKKIKLKIKRRFSII